MKVFSLLSILAIHFAVAKAHEKGDDDSSDDNFVQQEQLDFSILQAEQVAAPSTDTQSRQKEPSIAYDKIEPFEMAQPSSATISEKTAIRFRPTLYIANGCYPYPAVNKAGQVSKGIPRADPSFASCSKPCEGTQVYGRSAWFGTVWAIMYTWFFPSFPVNWEYAIVWMNNPNVTKMVVHGVTVSLSNGSVSSQLPPNPAMMRGWNAKIAYNNNGLESTTIDGGAQNLVMWHQLTLEAQEALNDKHSFGNAQVPFNDANFLRYLDASWPFSRDALKKA